MKTHEGERLGGWVRRFLVEHLVVERNLSGNTQRSYRDTLRLLIPFAADHHKTAVDRLVVTDVSADVVRAFLLHPQSSVLLSAMCADNDLFPLSPPPGHWPPARAGRRCWSPRAVPRQ